MANWATIEDTIISTISQAVVDPYPVYWEYQNHERAEVPFVTVHLLSDTVLGSVDDYAVTDTLAPSGGDEITFSVMSQRELVVRVSAFTEGVVRESSRAILFRIKARLALPSVLEALACGGLALVDRGVIQHIPVLLDTVYESRSVMEIRFRMCEAVEETNTYIETVESDGSLN